MSLIEHLQQIPDFRTQPRYPLWVILLLVIMGTMSGAQGYRALEDFVQRHQSSLIELLELPYKRLPAFSTLRRIMVRLDFVVLTQAFNAWASETFVQPNMQLATDGKGIKASVMDYDKSYQDFVNVVSAFSVQQGVVVRLEPMHNGHSSEIVTVQTLLAGLQLSGVCLTLDALHSQKKLWHR
jgi:DDE_Tnp_1-associated